MPSGSKDDTKPGFTVSDRRSFADTGAPRANEPTAPAPEAPTAPAASTPPAASAVPADPIAAEAAAGPHVGPTSADRREMPPVDFHTFLLSLGSSALLHLGELDQPDGSEARPDLPLAKHTIDVIVMLQEKTKGNLTPPEERLIESLLYDLRLRYVERCK